MKRIQKSHHSLFKKICVPLTVVILFQAILFFGATFYGGISETINQNARDVLTERVINREADLETKFSTQWTNFASPESNINDIYQNISEQADHPIYTDSELQKEVLEESNDILVNMIRSNEVTGVFLILNNEKEYVPLEKGGKQEKYGICIRDYSPTSEYTNREDLLMVRCPSAMIKNAGFSIETWWDALFHFDDQTTGDYYYKPLQMAYENPGTDNRNLAYFDGVHKFSNTDRMVVSYSIPLIDRTGYPYGVLGIELTTDYLKTLMTASNLYGDNAGCYSLVQYEEGSNQYQILAYDGVLFQQCFGQESSFGAESQDGKWFESNEIQSKIPVCGSLHNLQIYNRNTPYEKNKLALLGLVKEDTLYEINMVVRQRLLIVSVLVMLFGFLCVFCISRRLTHPIKKLSKKVHEMDADKGISLDRLKIDEIDELVESIEDLNDKVNRTAIRTEFFSRMSHDMRTPMNAIIGFSSPELLENADLEEMQEYMQKIHSSGGFLLTLINDVLDMTKIETQRMELREEPLTQQMILDSVVPIIAEVSQEKKIHFQVETDQNQTVFLGDRQRLGQILMNLLSNAVKFCKKEGTVLLSIKQIHKDKNMITSRIVIQDNGCGMSEEFQKKMYEPFSQEGKSEGGTGLGLAITKQMITLMGGTIKCRSEENVGTTFTITISNRIAEEGNTTCDHEMMNDNLTKTVKTAPTDRPDESTDKIKESDENLLKGKRILICEDHPINAQIARRLLERVGIVVDEAHDGMEGIEMFETSDENYYQLILMDIRMPRMNGIEAAKAIRQLERKDAVKIPIIAMTANAFKEDVEETQKAGMNEHLSKPIDPKILYVTLEKYMTL